MTMIKVKTEIPTLPNFIRSGENMIAIEDIEDEDFDLLCGAWVIALKKRREERKKIKKAAPPC